MVDNAPVVDLAEYQPGSLSSITTAIIDMLLVHAHKMSNKSDSHVGCAVSYKLCSTTLWEDWSRSSFSWEKLSYLE